MPVTFQRPGSIYSPASPTTAANQISPARLQQGAYTRSVSGGTRFTDTRVSPNSSIYNNPYRPLQQGGVRGTAPQYRNMPVRQPPGFSFRSPTPPAPSPAAPPPPIATAPPPTRGIPLSNLGALGIGSALAGGLDVVGRLNSGQSVPQAIVGGTGTGLGSLAGGLLGSSLGPAGTIGGSLLGGLLGSKIGDLIGDVAGINPRSNSLDKVGKDHQNQKAGEIYLFSNFVEIGWSQSSNNAPGSRIAKGFGFVAQQACQEGTELRVYQRIDGVADSYATCLAPGLASVNPYQGNPVTPTESPSIQESATPSVAPPLVYHPGAAPGSIPRATPGGQTSVPQIPTLPRPQPIPTRSPQTAADPRVEADPISPPNTPLFPPLVLPPPGTPNPGTAPGTIVLPPGQGTLQRPPGLPDECIDPCELAAFDAISGIRQLLDNLFPQSDGQGEPVPEGENPFERILQELEGIKESISGLDERLDNLEEALEAQDQFIRRSYRILGGDSWFSSGGESPQMPDTFETSLRNTANLWGFNAESEPQAIANSLPGLIRIYQSILYHRQGLHQFPAQTPPTLLSYSDGSTPITHQDFGDYFAWYVRQFDALMGQWPIRLTIEDIDPLQQGNQTQEIELPNLSEAIAEIYGLDQVSSTNAGLSINFLMRLAAEIIAVKNSSLITQDYVKANAAWMGYKGNPARREVDYNFNPDNLESLDGFLQEKKGYIQGWQEDDPESLVGFLQRLMFSAGIIKSVFFRGKNQLSDLGREIESMTQGDSFIGDEEWNRIIQLINDPSSPFNQGQIPRPNVDKKPNPGGNPEP